MKKKPIEQLKEGIRWLNKSDSFLADMIWLVIIFVFIKYIFFPGLGLLLHTQYPVVAIVSTSMEHHGNFQQWWNSKACPYCQIQSQWYAEHNISEQKFKTFPYQNGLNKGDVMILIDKKPSDIQIGQILVFKTPSGLAVIHRIVRKWNENGTWYFQTKGDANPISASDPSILETDISQNRIIGVAKVRIPYLGWIKVFINWILSALFHIRTA